MPAARHNRPSARGLRHRGRRHHHAGKQLGCPSRLAHVDAWDSPPSPPCHSRSTPIQNLDLSKPRALLNPLLPGKRVMAIIGFCDILHFDFIVRRLGTEVRVCVLCSWKGEGKEVGEGTSTGAHEGGGGRRTQVLAIPFVNDHQTCAIPTISKLNPAYHQAMAFVNQVAAIVHENTSVRSVCLDSPPYT